MTTSSLSSSRSRLLIGAVVAASSLAAVGGVAGATSEPSGSVPDDGSIDCAAVATSAEIPAQLTTFFELPADLSTLSDPTTGELNYTIFAPVNAAFEAIPTNVLESILADEALATSILQYHLIEGKPTVDELVAAGTVPTVLGPPLTFALDADGTLLVNTAEAICTEITFEEDDGVMYIISEVLQPPSGADSPTGSSVPGGSSLPGDSTPPGSSMPAEFDADQQAVADAWQTAIDSGNSSDVVAPLVEDAEAIRETIEAYPAAAEMVQGLSARVTSVTIDGDTAHVMYVVLFNGVEAPYGELEASLVNIDGAWIIPQDEFCAVMAYARNNC